MNNMIRITSTYGTGKSGFINQFMDGCHRSKGIAMVLDHFRPKKAMLKRVKKALAGRKGPAVHAAAQSTVILAASVNGDGASGDTGSGGSSGGGTSGGDGDGDGDGDSDSDRPAPPSPHQEALPVAPPRIPAVLPSPRQPSPRPRPTSPAVSDQPDRNSNGPTCPGRSDADRKDRRRSWLAFLLVLVFGAMAVLFALMDKDALASDVLKGTIPSVAAAYLVYRSLRK